MKKVLDELYSSYKHIDWDTAEWVSDGTGWCTWEDFKKKLIESDIEYEQEMNKLMIKGTDWVMKYFSGCGCCISDGFHLINLKKPMETLCLKR